MENGIRLSKEIIRLLIKNVRRGIFIFSHELLPKNCPGRNKGMPNTGRAGPGRRNILFYFTEVFEPVLDPEPGGWGGGSPAQVGRWSGAAEKKKDSVFQT